MGWDHGHSALKWTKRCLAWYAKTKMANSGNIHDCHKIVLKIIETNSGWMN